MATSEAHVQVIVWEVEYENLSVMVTQLADVEEYGLNKFLEENPLQLVDVGIIHILQKDIAWWVWPFLVYNHSKRSSK